MSSSLFHTVAGKIDIDSRTTNPINNKLFLFIHLYSYTAKIIYKNGVTIIAARDSVNANNAKFVIKIIKNINIKKILLVKVLLATNNVEINTKSIRYETVPAESVINF